MALRPVFRAGVRYAVALRAAVPVKAQGCGVVGELAAEGIEDRVGAAFEIADNSCPLTSRGSG